MIRIILLVFSILMFLFSYMYYIGEMKAYANFLLGFLGVAFILLSSFRGYKHLVNQSVEQKANLEVKDPIQSIEDPFDLYDEEEEETSQEFSLKEEKKKVKKASIKTMIKTKKGHLSRSRLLAYFVFAALFIYMAKQHYVDALALLLGVTVGLVTTSYGMFRYLKEKEKLIK